jgi:hypothetical protein
MSAEAKQVVLTCMGELEALFGRVRQSLEEGRFVEAQGWMDGAEDTLGALKDNLGELAADEVIKVVGNPATEGPMP